MIHYRKDHLALDLRVAVALLAFASTDSTRPHLGIGLDEGYLCSTDGCAGLRFEYSNCDDEASMPANGTVWASDYVKTAIKVARARKAEVVLPYADALRDQRFPPFARVLPDYETQRAQPTGIDPKYLAALATVTKAIDVKAVKLTSLRAALDPIGFTVDDHHGKSARVVIMPIRV